MAAASVAAAFPRKRSALELVYFRRLRSDFPVGMAKEIIFRCMGMRPGHQTRRAVMLSIDGIERLVEPVLTRLGLVLHQAELKREGKELVLRLTVDRADKKAISDGVTVDELAIASDEVGAALDLEDPISDRYRLVLESPGVERELTTIRHFLFARGEHVRVVTRGEDASVFEGILKDVNEETREILVETADSVQTIELGKIKSARTTFDWNAQIGTKRKF